MNKTGLKICLWSGPVGAIILFTGLWPVMHFLPPLAPSATAEQIGAIFRDNASAIRFGSILIMLSMGLFMAFFAAISAQMKRMEGGGSALALTQLITGMLGAFGLLAAPIIWSVAAFRPERPDEMILLLSDLGWVFFVIPVLPGFVQFMAIGLAVIGDKGTQPVLPRWCAYLHFWIAILFLPGCLITLFKTGPFAWNGLLAFWIPAILIGIWTNLLAYMLLKSVKQQERTAG